MNEKTVKFCLKCARPLDRRWNKKYDGSHVDFCNDRCKNLHKSTRKPKSKKALKKKNGHKDLFNGR